MKSWSIVRALCGKSALISYIGLRLVLRRKSIIQFVWGITQDGITKGITIKELKSTRVRGLTQSWKASHHTNNQNKYCAMLIFGIPQDKWKVLRKAMMINRTCWWDGHQSLFRPFITYCRAKMLIAFDHAKLMFNFLKLFFKIIFLNFNSYFRLSFSQRSAFHSVQDKTWTMISLK